jgi:hypothetical protein
MNTKSNDIISLTEPAAFPRAEGEAPLLEAIALRTKNAGLYRLRRLHTELK